MATISKKESSRTGNITYRVKVRLKGHPPVTASFARKTDAEKWATQTEAAIREGRYFKSSTARNRTVSEMIDRYIQVLEQRKPKRCASVKPYLEWWRTQIGSYALSDVSRALIIEKRDILVQGNVVNKKIRRPKTPPKKRSFATVNRYMSALCTAFTMAANEWEWLQDSPMRKISKLTEPRGRVRFLSEGERERLLAACKESESKHLYLIVLLAISTGARQGEILTLKWDNVDFERRMITLHHTKNGERRVLYISNHLLPLLKEQYESRPSHSNYVFPALKEDAPINFRGGWDNAVANAGLQDFRFHDLRHTAASYLAMNGATTNEIAEVLGHKTLAMVKRYSHLSDTHTASVVERMNSKIFA